MAAPRQSGGEHSWRQAHVDIGALAERVTGTERGLGSLSDQLGSFQRDTGVRFDNLTTSFGVQLRDIGAKIDAQANAYNASGRTDWKAFISAACGVVGIIMSIGAAVLIPQSGNIAENKVAIAHIIDTRFSKADAADMRAELSHWLDALALRSLSKVEHEEALKRIDERYKITSDDTNVRLGGAEKRISEIDAQLVKRPELEAQNRSIEAANKAQDDKTAMAINSLMQRVDALSIRQTAFDTQLSNLFPLSKVLDELWAGQREQRMGFGIPTPAK